MSVQKVKQDLETKAAQSEQQAFQLSAENAALEEEINIQKRALNKLQRDRDAALENIIGLRQRLKSLKTTSGKNKSKLNEHIKQQQKTLRAEMKNRKDQVATLEASMTQCARSLDKTRAQRADLNVEIAKMRNMHNACKTTLSDCQGRAISAENMVAMFKKKYESSQAKIRDLVSSNKALKRQLRSQKSQMTTIQGNLTSAQKQVSALQVKQKNLQDALMNTNGQYEQLVVKHQSIIKELHALEGNYMNAKRHEEALLTEKDKADKEKIRLKNFLEAVQNEKTDLTKDLAEVRNEMMGLVSDLKKKTKTLKASAQQSAEMKEYVDQVNTKMASLERSETRYISQMADLEASNTMLKKELKKFKDHTDAIQDELKSSQSREADAQKQHMKLTRELEQVQQGLSEKQAALAAAQDALDQTTMSLSDFEEKNRQLSEYNQRCETNFGNLRQQLEMKDRQVQMLENTTQQFIKGLRSTGRAVPQSTKSPEDLKVIQGAFMTLVQENEAMRGDIQQILDNGYRDNHDLRDQNAEMSRVIKRLNQEIRIHRQELSDNADIMKKAENQRVQYEQSMMKMGNHILQLNERIADLETASKNCLFKGEKEGYDKQIEQLNVELGTTSEMLNNFKRQKAQLLEQIKGMKGNQIELEARVKRKDFEMDNLRQLAGQSSALMMDLERMRKLMEEKTKRNAQLSSQMDRHVRQIQILTQNEADLKRQLQQEQSDKNYVELERKLADTQNKLNARSGKSSQFEQLYLNTQKENEILKARLATVSESLNAIRSDMNHRSQYVIERAQLEQGFASDNPVALVQNDADSAAYHESAMARQQQEIQQLQTQLNDLSSFEKKKPKVIKAAIVAQRLQSSPLSTVSDVANLVPTMKMATSCLSQMQDNILSMKQSVLMNMNQSVIKTASSYLMQGKQPEVEWTEQDKKLFEGLLQMEAERTKLNTIHNNVMMNKSMLLDHAHGTTRDELIRAAHEASRTDSPQAVNELMRAREAYEKLVRFKKNSIDYDQQLIHDQARKNENFVNYLYNDLLPSMRRVNQDIQISLEEYEKLYGQPFDMNVDGNTRQRLYDDFRIQAQLDIAESRKRMVQLHNKYAALNQESNATMNLLKDLLRVEEQKDRDDLIRRLELAREANFQKAIQDARAEELENKGKVVIQANVEGMSTADIRRELQKLNAGLRTADTVGDQLDLGPNAYKDGHFTIALAVSTQNTADNQLVMARDKWMNNPGVKAPYSYKAVGMDILSGERWDWALDVPKKIECNDILVCGETLHEKKAESDNELFQFDNQIMRYQAQKPGVIPVRMITSIPTKTSLILIPIVIPYANKDVDFLMEEQKGLMIANFIRSAAQQRHTSIRVHTTYHETDAEQQRRMISKIASMLSLLNN